MRRVMLITGIIVSFGAMALNGMVMWRITGDWLLTACAVLIPWIAAGGAAMAIAGVKDEG